jgi:hypothetical protein
VQSFSKVKLSKADYQFSYFCLIELFDTVRDRIAFDAEIATSLAFCRRDRLGKLAGGFF